LWRIKIASGDATPVDYTMQRLMSEGLDRHDAIHAVGSILIGHIADLLQKPNDIADPSPAYFEALERLTAEGMAAILKWRARRDSNSRPSDSKSDALSS
jgi:hypothetical protein